MKKLLLLPLLALSACCSSSSDPVPTDINALKFKAGDEVVATVGFYSSCDGVITDHSNYHDSKYGPAYLVSFYCPNVGWLKEDVRLLETSLTKKEN